MLVYTNSNFQYKKPAKWYTNSENGAVGKTFDMYPTMLSEYTLAFR